MELSNKEQVQKNLVEFFQKYRLVKYKKGELIFRPGDSFSQISFIKNGYVRLFLDDDNGKEITINVFKPIFYLSLYYALNEKESRYYFEAMTDVEIWQAPQREVFNFIRNDLEILGFLTDRLLKVVNELIGHVEIVISGDAYAKVAALIISLAKNSGHLNKGKIELDFTTTHRLIASLAGLTRETASIQIKKLERSGYIFQKTGTIIINDLDKMAADFVTE